jgi:hypothetical protein
MINVSIDTQTVEEAKREVINQLKPKINQACVEAVCREQYGIETITGYECKEGDIVIDNDNVVFKLDFEVRFPVSILINNGGNGAASSSEADELLSEFDASLEEIEPEEFTDKIDEELPDIDLKD